MRLLAAGGAAAAAALLQGWGCWSGVAALRGRYQPRRQLRPQTARPCLSEAWNRLWSQQPFSLWLAAAAASCMEAACGTGRFPPSAAAADTRRCPPEAWQLQPELPLVSCAIRAGWRRTAHAGLPAQLGTSRRRRPREAWFSAASGHYCQCPRESTRHVL